MPGDEPVRRGPSAVARASILLFLFFGLDKALGLVRQVVIGRQFGVSAELDAFNAANNLPDLLFALISGGALSIALIPVLTEWFGTRGREPAWELFSRVANWAFIITGSLALILAAFAGPLVRAEIGIAPGFTPERQALVADLMRLNLIATLIFSISGLVMAGLQSNRHFLLPALAPAIYDLGQITGALVLAPGTPYHLGALTLPAFGLGIHGLVYGVILGAALHLGVQVPGLIRYRFQWSPLLGLRDPGLRKVARLLAPRIVTIGTFQLMFVVQDNLASRLEVGSVTALAYGWQIMQVPETLVATAMATALLPTLAEAFARGETADFGARVGRGSRLLLAVMAPLSVIVMVVLQPLVQAAFGFDARGTQLVVTAARAYLAGMAGHALLELIARAYYARQSPRWPLLASGLRAVLFLILSLALFRPIGALGIAAANSTAFTVEAVILLVLLARWVPGISLGRSLLFRTAAASAAGGAAAWFVIGRFPGSPLFGSALAGLAGVAAAIPFVWRELKQIRDL